MPSPVVRENDQRTCRFFGHLIVSSSKPAIRNAKTTSKLHEVKTNQFGLWIAVRNMAWQRLSSFHIHPILPTQHLLNDRAVGGMHLFLGEVGEESIATGTPELPSEFG